MIFVDESDSLSHYGVLGMKWGVRKDGMPQGYEGSARKTKKARKQMQKQIRKTNIERIYNNKRGIGENTARVSSKMKRELNSKNSDLEKKWDKVAAIPGKETEADRIESRIGKNSDDVYNKYKDEYLEAAIKDLGFEDIDYGRTVIKDLDLEADIILTSSLYDYE